MPMTPLSGPKHTSRPTSRSCELWGPMAVESAQIFHVASDKRKLMLVDAKFKTKVTN